MIIVFGPPHMAWGAGVWVGTGVSVLMGSSVRVGVAVKPGSSVSVTSAVFWEPTLGDPVFGRIGTDVFFTIWFGAEVNPFLVLAGFNKGVFHHLQI